jgi:type IV pilus assembly protein PilV
MNMSKRHAPAARGFSLVEVLVTIVVLAVGLLGLAKMQAAAISNTKVSGVRALISLQASSLASAMHGNRGYWAAGVAPATFSVSGTTVVDSTGVLTGTTDCAAATCTPAQLAAYDVATWARAVNSQFPSYSALVTCSTVITLPVSCDIKLSWSEKYVAINRTTAASGVAQTSTQSFTLHVKP